MTIYILEVLLFLFGTSLLLHVQFSLLLLDLHTGFSRARPSGQVFSSFSEFPNVYCNPHRESLNNTEVDLLECSWFFNDPADVGNLISGSSAFSKTSLNIWKFMGDVLLKHGLESFEHYFTNM